MNRLLRTAAWMAPALAMIAAPALADAVRLAISENDDGARIEARWADGREGEPPRMNAAMADGVLRLEFLDPVEVDASALATQAPRTVTFAQADEGGRSVRLALRRELTPQVGAANGARVVALTRAGAPASIAAPDTPAAAVATPAPAAPRAMLTVGLREEFTRLSFRWPAPTTILPMQTGDQLELRFNNSAEIDLAEFRASLPRFVREARLVSRPGQPVRIALTLQAGVRQRHFVDGDRTVLDLLAPLAPAPDAAPATQEAAASPAPETFTAPRAPSAFSVVEEATATRINVEFPTPTRAVAFRRGDAIWVLMESGGRLNMQGVARAGPRHTDMAPIARDGLIGLRIPAPPDMQISARADGGRWTFTIAARQTPAEGVTVRRDIALANLGRLVAEFGRAGSIRWIEDPGAGDRIGVALLAGPARGVAQRRATLEAALLPSAHGAVIEPRADDVTAAFERGSLIVSRGNGLIAAAAPLEDGESDNTAPDAAVLLDTAQSEAPIHAGVRRRLDELQRAAAMEGMAEGAPVEARLALARYLVANELAPEALGALRIAAINQPEIEIDPEFRLLRASANVMMHRTADARADLQASSLQDNPTAALWRGYGAARDEDWEAARRELERGQGAIESQTPEWRARFRLALAEAALQLGDVNAAEEAARVAHSETASSGARLRASLILARAAAARGDETGALAVFDQLALVRDEEVAVRATLEGVRLRRASRAAEAPAAITALESLRYRWRGDTLELDVVAALGEAYMETARWRDALTVMQSAADRNPHNPAGRRLRADMVAAFERLFLDGEADRLEPIQALGLFYQFVDLTPVGPNGDRIVRLLAGRLVQVDLLEQAAQLLQHQVDERLQGVARAQVAGDLAAIYLLDRQGERAFQALAQTRVANLPANVQAERRILEARALLEMGRLDHALEMVERDQSADGQFVRAEAAWRSRDWERASAELRRLIALRPRAAAPDAEGRLIILRTAIAMTLAGEDEALRAFYRDHAGDMAGTPDAEAFETVAAGIDAEGVAVRDLARVVSRAEVTDRFLQRIRARMTEGAPARPQTPAPRAPAAPPPAQAAAPAPQRPAAPPARAPGV